jgi:hypothetical protein
VVLQQTQQVEQAVKDLLVAVVVLLFFQTQPQQELQQVALEALAISLQVELVAHQLLLTQAVQAEAEAVTSLLVAMLQVTQVELVEMVEVEVEALTTLEHLVLAVTA